MDDFWKFTQNTLGEYLFEEESMSDEYGTLNLSYLNEKDEEE